MALNQETFPIWSLWEDSRILGAVGVGVVNAQELLPSEQCRTSGLPVFFPLALWIFSHQQDLAFLFLSPPPCKTPWSQFASSPALFLPLFIAWTIFCLWQCSNEIHIFTQQVCLNSSKTSSKWNLVSMCVWGGVSMTGFWSKHLGCWDRRMFYLKPAREDTVSQNKTKAGNEVPDIWGLCWAASARTWEITSRGSQPLLMVLHLLIYFDYYFCLQHQTDSTEENRPIWLY